MSVPRRLTLAVIVFLFAGAVWANLSAAPAGQAPAAPAPLNIIAFGAHPDDCDIRAGGTAAKWAAAGHRVRFVSVTNGDAGHQSQGGGALAARRRAEAQEAGRRLGVDYITLDNHDGELMPTLQVREQVIRLIRQWKADLVLGPRPHDYHPDHRYTGILLQDAAFMVTVPNIAPDTPSLRQNPVFMYFEDSFQKPNPFTPDVAVSIDDTFPEEDRRDRRARVADVRMAAVAEWPARQRAEGPGGAEGDDGETALWAHQRRRSRNAGEVLRRGGGREG